MVNVAQALSSGASSAAQYARASAASAALSTEPIENTATVEAAVNLPAEQTVLSVDRSYRYNSFEFSYRQDFGKIVLIRQRPDTGELVQQFPSEYYLRKYADSQRVAQSAANEHVGTGAGEKGATAAVRQALSGQSPTAQSPVPQQPAPAATSAAPTAAPAAPTVSAAPALPSGGVGSNTSLNLTV